MNQSDRDILVSLVEQNKSIIREMQSQNDHHTTQNGHILDLIKCDAEHNGRIKRNWLFVRIAGTLGLVAFSVLLTILLRSA